MTRTFTLRSFLFTQGIFHSRKELNLNEFVEKSWSNIRIPLPRQFYPRLRSSTFVRIPLSAFGTIKIHGYANTVYFAADTFLFRFERRWRSKRERGRPVVATMQRRRRQEDGGHKIFVVRDKISNLSRLFCLIELFKTSDKS